MDEMLPNTTVSTDAMLFREEAKRARRYANAMTDKKVIDRTKSRHCIPSLRTGNTPDPPIAIKSTPSDASFRPGWRLKNGFRQQRTMDFDVGYDDRSNAMVGC
jgi:hypothetical protein